MTTTYSSALRLALQGTGDNSGTWGAVANAAVFQLIEDSIAKVATINVGSAGDYTLTTNNGSTDEARSASLFITGSPVSSKNVIIPAVNKVYIVAVSIGTSAVLTLKTNSGAGVTFTNGQKSLVVCDGLDTFAIRPVLSELGGASLSSAQTFTGGQRTNTTTVLSSSGSVGIDLDLNNDFAHVLTENTVLGVPSNCKVGQKGQILFTNAATPKTLGFNAVYKFPNGSVPALTASAGALDLLSYTVITSSVVLANMTKGFA